MLKRMRAPRARCNVPGMRTSTSYLFGATVLLLITAYMILTPGSAWYEVMTIAVTTVGATTYLVCGIREMRNERVTPSSVTPLTRWKPAQSDRQEPPQR